jgi:hypothetical protein
MTGKSVQVKLQKSTELKLKFKHHVSAARVLRELVKTHKLGRRFWDKLTQPSESS